jgi:hypothetical protein
MQETSNHSLMLSPYDRIYLEIVMNRDLHPSGRHYSIETLIWIREIQVVCPTTLENVRQVLPLLRESLPNSRFAETHRNLSDAFQDMSRISELIELWNHDISEDVTDRRIILVVDVIVFRPVVTINEDGEVRGLKYLKQIHDPD